MVDDSNSMTTRAMNINGRTLNDTETGAHRSSIHSNDIQLNMTNNNLSISEPKLLSINQLRSPKGSMNSYLALAWINLSYYGTKLCGKSGQPILNQLKGQIDFGTLTALMGPSGSGKTTLLRCINGVNMDGIGLHTEIYVSKYVPIRPCYIQQDVQQHLLMSLNVKESLKYASKLKNRSDKSVANRHVNLGELIHTRNIENILNELLLTDCANTTVSRCSGGEQKRLIIAMELTAHIKPNLICIDEPTSGLDSNAAEQTMLCLQNIARKHSLAIVTSIHQPNSDVMRMFDQLYVLAKGGRCIFRGPPHELKNHLCHCDIECREDQTPIEVLLKIASKRVKTLNADEVVIELGPPDDVMSLVIKTYDNMKSIKTECVTEAKRIVCGELTGNNVRIHPFDMFYLLQRFAIFTYLKQWKLTLAQFLIHIILVFVFITLYRSDIGSDANCPHNNVTELYRLNSTMVTQISESLAQQNTKFLFILVLMLMFLQMCASVLTFPMEIQIFFNEHRNRWYSCGSYFWPKTIVDIPLLMVTVYFYTWIGYYFTSQPDMNYWYNGIVGVPERYALFALVLFMTAICIQGLSMISGIIFAGDFRLALIFAVILTLLNVLFCGIYIQIEYMPAFYRGIQHITFMKHSIDSMMILIYGRDRCGPQSVSLSLTASRISEHDFWWKLLWILIHAIVYRFIALIAIYIKANGVQRFFNVKKFKACLQL